MVGVREPDSDRAQRRIGIGWRGVVSALGLLAALTGVACSPSPSRTAYWDAQLNKATQADIRQRLGPPTATYRPDSGEARWVYRVGSPAHYVTPTAASGDLVLGTAACQEYVLTFDPEHILRRWARQAC